MESNAFILPSSRIKNEHFEQRLLCIICNNILWRPVACASCCDHFCSFCIYTWNTKSKNSCPKCKSTPFKSKKAIPLVNGMLGDLIVECLYTPNGCKENIPYDLIEMHEKNCLYCNYQCTYCKQFILKKDLKKHECDEKEVICNECEMKYDKKSLKNHDKEACYLNIIATLKERIGSSNILLF